MDIDPIQDNKSFIEIIFEKLKNIGKKFNKQKIKEPNYEEIVDHIRENNKNIVTAFEKMGESCQQASKSMLRFNDILTPAQMREIAEDEDEVTLYADGQPVCILKKGEPVWTKTDK